MSLPLTHFDVRLRLVENMLGTVPKNQNVYTAHIATKNREVLEKQLAQNERLPNKPGTHKQPNRLANGEVLTSDLIEAAIEEETVTVAALEERGWTTFHADEEGPFLFDYLLKGFLCESARALKEHGNMLQLADKVKRYVFVKPRKVRLPQIAGCIERPLRAITAQGPRVAVVRSDFVAAGTELAFRLHVLSAKGVTFKRKTLVDIMEYGTLQGLGQWRSGGNGTFEVVHLELVGDEPAAEVDVGSEAA